MTKEKAKRYAPNHGTRKVISFILAFILSLSLLGITVLGVVKNGLFSEQTILKNMGEDYYNAVFTKAEEALSDYTIPTGIDTSVVEDVVSIDDVRTDVNGYIYAAFAGREYTPNTAQMDQRIKANVEQFFADNSVEIDGETEDIIDTYIEELDKVYTSSISLKVISSVVKANNLFSRYYIPVLIALCALSVLLGYGCVKIHHYPHRGLRYVAYAAGGTALMSLVAPAAVLVSGIHKRLRFEPEHFYKLVVRYVQGFFTKFIYASAFWFLAAAIIILLVYLLKTEKLKAKK